MTLRASNPCRMGISALRERLVAPTQFIAEVIGRRFSTGPRPGLHVPLKRKENRNDPLLAFF